MVLAEGELPEPILVESVTDVDSREAGELELELLTSVVGLHPGSPYAMRLEAEWRVTERLGFKLEAGFDRTEAVAPSVSAGTSFVLFHLMPLNLHGQAVVYGRWPLDRDDVALLDPAEPVTLVAAGAHLAWQWRLLSARAEVTSGVGGPIAYAPIRANAALLFGTGSLFGGFEAMTDFARREPLLLAFEAELRQLIDENRFGVAVAIPFEPKIRGTVGLILRVQFAIDG
jgi:hypothetical protein